MVSPQVTQNGNPPHPRPVTPNDWPQADVDESVRITAVQYEELRRRVLVEHYTERLVLQQALVADEAADRKLLGPQEPVFSYADLRVSNKAAVLQDISATLKSFGDENRDYSAKGAVK